MYFQVEYGGRPRWKEAFEIIQTERQVGDQVVTSLKQMTDFYLPQLPTDQSLKIDLVNMPESQFNTRTWFIVDNDRFISGSRRRAAQGRDGDARISQQVEIY